MVTGIITQARDRQFHSASAPQNTDWRLEIDAPRVQQGRRGTRLHIRSFTQTPPSTRNRSTRFPPAGPPACLSQCVEARLAYCTARTRAARSCLQRRLDSVPVGKDAARRGQNRPSVDICSPAWMDGQREKTTRTCGAELAFQATFDSTHFVGECNIG